MSCRKLHFTNSNIDPDSVTLILKLNLDMVMMYHQNTNENSTSSHSKVIAQTDTHTEGQTDRQPDKPTHIQYENITFPHTQEVKINSIST